MASASNKAINPWEWDVRVRERNIGKGIFDAKDAEKHIAQLPDVAEKAEVVSLPQPALGGHQER